MEIAQLRDGTVLSRREQMALVFRLSLPAILAQITSIAMQYIDAAMVGSLGANATAAIGLVSSTTWLIGGLCVGMSTGFSVQVAQLVGAGREAEARDVFRQAILSLMVYSALVAAVSAGVSGALPYWLGGEADICPAAARYYLIFSLAIPFAQLRQLSGSMLQCSGDMKTPSILNASLCGCDVVLNFLLIFPSRTVTVLGFSLWVPGAGLGVTGAALGTAFSDVIIAALMFCAAGIRSPKLTLRKKGSWKLRKKCLLTAAKVAIPLSCDHIALCSAYVAATKIVAPLGTLSVAANSLAVTAESLCYMPGYGIGSAATTLVGQSIGAGRKDLSRQFARLAVLLGMSIMACTGLLMMFLAPFAFALLTPDAAVRALGTHVLRLELFSEPLYGASIVCAGALRGAGDTLVPSILNLVSMWGVRITASLFLAPRFGLTGVWVAMAGELCFRGIIFLVRLLREKWLEKEALV